MEDINNNSVASADDDDEDDDEPVNRDLRSPFPSQERVALGQAVSRLEHRLEQLAPLRKDFLRLEMECRRHPGDMLHTTGLFSFDLVYILSDFCESCVV